MVELGVIADIFSGDTDIDAFFFNEGLSTLQDRLQRL